MKKKIRSKVKYKKKLQISQHQQELLSKMHLQLYKEIKFNLEKRTGNHKML